MTEQSCSLFESHAGLVGGRFVEELSLFEQHTAQSSVSLGSRYRAEIVPVPAVSGGARSLDGFIMLADLA